MGVMGKAVRRLSLTRIALQRQRDGCRGMVAKGLGQVDQARAQAAIGKVDLTEFLFDPGVGADPVDERPRLRPDAELGPLVRGQRQHIEALGADRTICRPRPAVVPRRCQLAAR